MCLVGGHVDIRNHFSTDIEFDSEILTRILEILDNEI